MNKGIDKQIQLFLRDYRDGEAFVQNYLKVINNPDYLTRKEAYHSRGGSHSKSKTTHKNNGRTQRLDRRDDYDSMD